VDMGVECLTMNLGLGVTINLQNLAFHPALGAIGIQDLMVLSCHAGQLRGINWPPSVNLPNIFVIQTQFSLSFRMFRRIMRTIINNPAGLWIFVNGINDETGTQYYNRRMAAELIRRGYHNRPQFLDDFHLRAFVDMEVFTSKFCI